MKKCLYCAEEIQDEAIICRYCKNVIDEELFSSIKDGISCFQCGSKNTVEAKYCAQCGARLETPEEDKQEQEETRRENTEDKLYYESDNVVITSESIILSGDMFQYKDIWSIQNRRKNIFKDSLNQLVIFPAKGTSKAYNFEDETEVTEIMNAIEETLLEQLPTGCDDVLVKKTGRKVILTLALIINKHKKSDSLQAYNDNVISIKRDSLNNRNNKKPKRKWKRRIWKLYKESIIVGAATFGIAYLMYPYRFHYYTFIFAPISILLYAIFPGIPCLWLAKKISKKRFIYTSIAIAIIIPLVFVLSFSLAAVFSLFG